ncbi:MULTISPECIES: polysaccharide pyruvyl transferase family protein [Olivibacter]|uniref:Polysaccharide pyruvyl transferase family protein n=1 Tax=Olivibacter jilunii TaxID=985016 RepID=A0ABW6B7M9_9SPHI
MADNKYGVMACSRPLTNIGDFVQAIAARQFLPSVDAYCDREELNTYNGEKVKMIMNGWYMHNADNWPPSDKIDPLYVSMHINSSVYSPMTTEKSVEHFKAHSPIGCRDKATARLLQSKGIDAYFSGCLTLTLGKTYKRETVTDDIFIVDPLFHYWSLGTMLKNPRKLIGRIMKGRFTDFLLKNKVLEGNFAKDILENGKQLTQVMPMTDVETSFKIADEYLKKLCSAKLVLTSRIHCALPCLAMGTPVIFLNGGFENKNNQFTSRFEGLIDFFNRIDIDKNGNITRNFDFEGKLSANNFIANKTDHIKYANDLIDRCEKFVNS